jgi:N-acetylmuramoyl-L-alanine amidase
MKWLVACLLGTRKIKKISSYTALLFAMVALNMHVYAGAQGPDNSTSKYAVRTVCIDAGHGGKDEGASGFSGKKEKNIALAVALKLGAYIEQNFPDVKVVYTRKTDVFVELYERAAIANRAKADLFISIHLNSSTNSDAYGCEAWVLGLHRSESNLEVAKRENAVIKLEDQQEQHYEFDPNSEAGHIIMSMAQTAYLDQSIDLASNVMDQFENKVKRKSRGVKQAGFMVLYKTAMPATLIELGFISNQEEESFLSHEEGQDYIASAIYRSFAAYKARMDAKVHHGDNSNKADSSDEYKPVKGGLKVPEVKSSQSTKPSGNTTHGGSSSTATKPTTNTTSAQSTSNNGNSNVTSGVRNGERVLYQHNPQTEQRDKHMAKDSADKYAAQKNNIEVKKEYHTAPEEGFAPPATIFRIQFSAAVTKAAKGSKFERDFPRIIYEDNGKGVLRYMSGEYKSYAEAKSALANVKAIGYKDAFVVVYESGKRGDINKYNR